ncbi:MAG TPA: carboxypeptidase-like regulatory domain-containing protein, partial [Thermoanaerobaculia bacterium]
MKRLVAVALLLAAAAAYGQVAITGRVIDESGSPLSGVRVGVEDIAADISACCGPSRIERTGADGSFAFDVRPSIYVLETMPNPAFNPDRKRVDARSGGVSAVVLRPTTGAFTFMPDTTPRAALISIGIADVAGMAPIRGLAGAVDPDSIVIFSTLETGHLSTTEAANDGSFSATHFAPAGSFVLIKADPYGHLARRALRELAFEGEGSLSALPGTIVPASEPPLAVEGISFANCGLYHDQTPPIWFMEGTINKQQFVAGDALVVKGKLRVESRSLNTAGPMAIMLFPGLDLLARSDGSSALPNGNFASTVMLPTGIPLEHGWDPGTPTGLGGGRFELTRTAPDRAEAAIELSITIPSKLAAGYYRPSLFIPLDGGTNPVPPENPPRPLMVSDRIGGKRPNVAFLPIIRIGDPSPPQLVWTLLSDDLSNGSRGSLALEDRERFGLASRILVNSETFVVPRLDELSGKPIQYRLEPFAPTISLGDRAVSPSAPRLSFRFPSGNLKVTITKPDGSTETIGPAPFVQSRQSTPVNRNGDLLEPGSGTLSDVYQLSTMDPRFLVSFTQDGLHRITFEGSILDIWGNEWSGRGTYDVVVARLLSLDTATIPGTPFEVGDSLTPSVVIAPSVPADVEMRVQWFPDSDRALRKERIIIGRANRFGHFITSPGVRFDHAGEYRVDVTARWADATGNLWMGSRTWAGVIASRNSTLEAHGKRGTDAQADPRPTWFMTPRAFGHVFIPFHSGDVQWAQQFHAVLPLLTFQDLTGTAASLLKGRAGAPPDIDSLAALGELPLFSSRADGYPIYLDPSLVDLWGYQYTAVERPLVRVREQNPMRVGSLYWRFRSQYAQQFGVGANGDLPNDFKFQFGGAVLRGSAVGAARYGIYGSLFILVADDDARGGSRIFPPFQGNGGGPSGGPLFTLKGKPIDIFFHPTSVRPGSILVSGNLVSFSGQIGPTLPSKVEITVTAPSGRVRAILGQANKVGYFYDPPSDFRVD